MSFSQQQQSSYATARDKVFEAVDIIHKGCLHLQQEFSAAGPYDVLQGLLPITFRSATYNIPVEIFLNRQTYPREQPQARVIPTQTMEIVPGVHVDGQTGDVRFGQYNWDGDFLSWLRELQRLFEQRPPVKARRQQQQPPPPPQYQQQQQKTSAPIPEQGNQQPSNNNATPAGGPAQYQWAPNTPQDSFQQQQQQAKQSAPLPNNHTSSEMPPPPAYGVPPPQYGSPSTSTTTTAANKSHSLNPNPYVAESVLASNSKNDQTSTSGQQGQKGAAPLPE